MTSSWSLQVTDVGEPEYGQRLKTINTCSVCLGQKLVLSKYVINLIYYWFFFLCKWICALSKAPWLGSKSTCMSNKTIMGLYLCLLSVPHLTAILCNPHAINLLRQWYAAISCRDKGCLALIWVYWAIVRRDIVEYLNILVSWKLDNIQVF